MNATERAQYKCVACGENVNLTPDRRCENCGVSYASPEARGVADADTSIAQLRAQAQEIDKRIAQWETYREGMIARLKRTAPVGWASLLVKTADAVEAPAAEAPAAEAPLAEVAPEPAAAPAPVAESAPVAAPGPVAAAAAPSDAHTSAPAESVFARPHAPREPGRAAEVARKAMSAPALLGIAGASLLIAASIVFVALAWTAFPPLYRGIIVSAVALLVSGIAIWLKRMQLDISSGAVGLVAMGFAATASLAFSRGGDTVGAFETPTAFLIAAVSGLVLSRLGIAWTGSAAGLAFAAAAVGFTIATTSNVSAADGPGDPGPIRGIWIWSMVGTLAAAVLAATHRFWKFPVARVAVRWGAVVWLFVVGAGAIGWAWINEANPLDGVVALLPVVALVVLARWWPLLATGPAVFLLTASAPAIASTMGASAWQQATAAAVAVAVLLAVGPRMPVDTRLPMFIALSPAYLTVAIASATYSILITVARIIAGVYTPDTELWAGIAALVAGFSIAQLRLWRLDNPFVRAAQIVGAAMVVTGAGIVAFGIAEAPNRDYHSFVALTMSLAGAGLLAAVWAWSDARARWFSANSGVAFALVAAFHGGWGIVISEIHLSLGLGVMALALAVLAWRATQSPWWGAFPGVLVLLTVLPSVASRYDLEVPWVLGAGVLVAAAIIWGARGIPERFQRPTLVALLPALGVTVLASIAVAVDLISTPFRANEGGINPGWLVVTVVGAAGLAGMRRWPRIARFAPAAAVIGAASTVPVAVSSAVLATDAWLPDVTGGGALFAVPLALALAATGWVWRSKPAAWTSGVSATVMLTVAGLSASLDISPSRQGSWLPGAVAFVVVVLLAGFSRWWPRVTLAPAALVFTTAAAGAVALAENGQLTLLGAAVAACLAVWLMGRFRPQHAVVGAVGTVPALIIAGAYASAAVLFGAVNTLGNGFWEGENLTTGLSALLLVVIAGHFALLSWLRQPTGKQALRLGTIFAAFGAVVVAADAVGEWAAELPGFLDRTQGRAVAVVLVTVVGVALIALGAVWARGRAVISTLATRIVDIGGVAWLTLVGIAVSVLLVPASQEWPAITAAVAAIIATLAVIAKWRAAYTAGSIALLAVVLPFALLVNRAGYAQAVLAVTVVAAATIWLVRWRWPKLSVHVMVGQGVVYALAVVVVMQSLATSLARVAYLDQSYDLAVLGLRLPWSILTVVVAAVGLLTFKPVRAWVGTVALLVLAITVHPLVPLAAGAVLAVAGLAAAILGRKARAHDAVALAITLYAVLWAWQTTAAMALGMAIATVAAVAIARRQGPVKVQWAAALAPFTAGAAVGFAASAAGGPALLVAPLGMAAIAGAALLFPRIGVDPHGTLRPWVIAIATVLIPLASGDLGAAGVTLLVACAAWVALGRLGVTGARWWCAATVSLGMGLVFGDVGASAIEAYTVVPALSAITLGVMWMRANPKVRSITALWPGLVIGLVPSYFALGTDADSLPRTVWLTLAIVVLALLGARLRWFALVLGTATTALVVSALQIIVGSNMVLRLISFAVVGSLLLAIASWFERIKTLR